MIGFRNLIRSRQSMFEQSRHQPVDAYTTTIGFPFKTVPQVLANTQINLSALWSTLHGSIYQVRLTIQMIATITTIITIIRKSSNVT